MQNKDSKYSTNFPTLLIGDWMLIIGISLILFGLFKHLWSTAPANTLRIRVQDHIHGEYSLNQNKTLRIKGAVGHSIIDIHQGQVRFKHAPCNHQYCVRQGWLNKANQIAICLPNQMSIELIGSDKNFDTLNY